MSEEIKPNGNLDPKVSNLASVGVGSSHKGDGDKNHHHHHHPDDVHGDDCDDDNNDTQVELLWWQKLR